MATTTSATHPSRREPYVTPPGYGVDIEAIRLDETDGDSRYYTVEWCLATPTAWVSGKAPSDIEAQLARTSELLASGMTLAEVGKVSPIWAFAEAVDWEYGPTVTTPVHVMGADVYVFDPRLPRWVAAYIKRSVQQHLARFTAEVAA